MSDPRPPSDTNEDFAGFIADALTSYLAGVEDLHDLVLRHDGNQIVYVDIEESAVYLITCERAQFVVAGSS